MKTSYTSVDEMILTLPDKEAVVVRRLRALVKECLPKATEKLSYGVPYYSNHKMICFIWPPSVYWGPEKISEKQKQKGVTLGFSYGHQLADDEGLLLAEGRKQVYVLYFHTIRDIDEQAIRSLLFEAGLLDDTFGARKKTKSHKRRSTDT